MRGLGRRREGCLALVAVALSFGFGARAVAGGEDIPSSTDGDFPTAGPPSSPPATEVEPAAPVAAVPTTEGEAPGAPPGVTPRTDLPPLEGSHHAWLRHPGNALTFDLGYFLGGADLAAAMDANGNTVRKISLGSGVLFTIGGMVTPLWIGDSAGFGLTAFAGVKADSLSADNGGVWMSRFPVGAGLHVLLHLNARSWLLLRGGLQKELGINISGDGELAGGANPQGSLGGFGEGGVYLIPPIGENHTAFVLTFRYGAAHDTIGGTSQDANSGGIVLAVHYNFI